MRRHSASAVPFALLVLSLAAETPAAQCGSTVVLRELPAGTDGPALRTPDGAPVIGGPFSFRIEGAPPNADGALVFSGIESPVFEPTVGATLHFGVPFDTIFFTTDAEGSSADLVVVGELDPSFCGAFAIFQAGVFDPMAMGGVGVTNGIRLLIGAPNDLLFGDVVLPNGASVLLVDLDQDGLLDRVASDANGTEVSLGVGDGFGPATSWPLATTQRDLTAADVNGDGQLDVVGLSSAMLGDGTGGFFAFSGVYGGILGTPRSVAIDDLDMDGEVDVVIASTSSTGGIWRVSGLGSGIFGFAQLLRAGATADLVAADLDEDGACDLVGALASSDEIVVLTGVGDGTFDRPELFPAGGAGLEEPASIEVGDLDGDTFLDVACVLDGGTVSTLAGDGAGSLGAPTVLVNLPGADELDLGDLDGVGGLDIVLAAPSEDHVHVLRGVGDGTFAASETFLELVQPRSLAIGDIGQDGLGDLVVGGLGGYVELRADGQGGLLGVRRYRPAFFADQLHVADLDHDGKNDLVVEHVGPNGAGVLLGVGKGSLQPPTTVATGTDELALGDVDGDGFVDLVGEGSGPESLRVWLNDGSGGFPASLDSPGAFPRDMVLADIDGDQVLDAVGNTASGGDDFLVVWTGVGDGTFSGPTTLLAADVADSPEVVDLNGDGALDVVTRAFSGFSVWLNDGNGALGPEVQYAGGGLYAVADLDGDTFPDMVLSSGGLRSRLNAGNGTFGALTASIPVSFVNAVTLDVNGDDVLDVVCALSQVLVCLGNGDGTFTLNQTIVPPGSLGPPRLVDEADFDGDGDTDLLVRYLTTADLSLFENLGNGKIAEVPLPLDEVGAGIARDLDGDGIPDALLHSSTGPEVWTMINRLGE